MQCSFHAAQPGQIERISGSLNPFGGWVVIGQTPTAANAVRVRSGSEQGWQLAVCSLDDGGAVKTTALTRRPCSKSKTSTAGS